MGDELARFTAAAVQASPVFLDREATIDKACDLIARAGCEGARLIVFPETWVPTYPYWIWGSDRSISASLFTELFLNSVEVPSPTTDKLCEAARKADAYIVMGINERDTQFRGTIYNCLLYIDPEGRIIGKHRKLMPTAMERTVWGWGDGSGLHVFDTPVGRLGGLICWEHEMTLVKYALYSKGEQVHASVWPAMSTQNHHIDFGCRQYAFEGRCFVVVSCGFMTEDRVPQRYGLKGLRSLDTNGGSGIIGPDGEYLAGPLYGREDILYAEIDLKEIIRGKYSLDVVGHYSRPDVVQLLLDERPRPPVIPVTAEPSAETEEEVFAMLDDIVAEAEERGAQRALAELEAAEMPRNRAGRRRMQRDRNR